MTDCTVSWPTTSARSIRRYAATTTLREQLCSQIDIKEWLDSSLFGVAIMIDFVLTTTLVIILHNARTEFSSTNKALDRLMIYAVVASESISCVRA